jgi:hypothetical protein
VWTDSRGSEPQDDFIFNENGDLVDRIENNQPDRFYIRENSLKITYQHTCVQICELQEATNEISLDSDIGHMARTVFAEAGGQNSTAKLALAEVIRNRANDNTTPSAANNYNAQFSKVSRFKDVVQQSGQFESVGNKVAPYSNTLNYIGGDGQTSRNNLRTNAFVESLGMSIRATRQNTNIAQGATHFFSPYIPTPNWTSSMTRIQINGVRNQDFRFYKY